MGEVDATSMGRPSEVLDTPLAYDEKSKLRVVIGRADGLAMILCALVGFDPFGKLTSEGAQVITWLLFLGIIFFVPYAMLCTELGTAFPVEGGPYVWVKLAFGRFTAAMASLLYWIHLARGHLDHHRGGGVQFLLHATGWVRQVRLLAAVHLDWRRGDHLLLQYRQDCSARGDVGARRAHRRLHRDRGDLRDPQRSARCERGRLLALDDDFRRPDSNSFFFF